jgi:hypothetical protein
MSWFALFTVAGFGVYLGIIRPKLRQFRTVARIFDKIDASGATQGERFKLWLLGQKTVFSGMIGVFVTTMPGILDQLHLIDFSMFVTPDLALRISGVIMLLMSVFHIYGMVTAAMIEPVKQD